MFFKEKLACGNFAIKEKNYTQTVVHNIFYLGVLLTLQLR
jgi:hypothetical protein